MDHSDDEDLILIPQYKGKYVLLRQEIEDENLIRRYYQLKITDPSVLPQYLKIYLKFFNWH